MMMKDYEPALSFDEESAERYDSATDVSQRQETVAATVDFLERLAGGGPALELAIGTGRIALPLAARGIRVDGVDFSPAMVAKLRGKPGAEHIAVTMGNFADVPVQGNYRLIYLVFNTLFNLLTQDDQVRCFENAAAHLTDDGMFVVEAQVPTFLTALRDGQYVNAEAVAVNEVWLDVGRYDPVTQRLEESHVRLSREGVRVAPIVTRYAWPSELDLMARIAGLRLRERWAGWDRAPFTAASGNHVSVYGR
jgi:methyltransferase family protein